MGTLSNAILIYVTQGEVEAVLIYPYIYSLLGEWIGWVTPERDVYSVHGHYVGWLSDDPRILRRKSADIIKNRREPPPEPEEIMIPATFPLAPMLPELPIGWFDVLEEMPELLPAVDYGDLRDDMD